jgi:hypothetical protein
MPFSDTTRKGVVTTAKYLKGEYETARGKHERLPWTVGKMWVYVHPEIQ